MAYAATGNTARYTGSVLTPFPRVGRCKMVLLMEHYPEERAEALEHLDFAIGEFRDMKMQPSLERALRHRGILNA